MDQTYDCLVIGGGSAGYAAARTAVSHGLHTAVVDGAETLGGLCILHGCMPSKSLIESANRYHAMSRASEFGLRAESLTALPEEIQARKRQLIDEFASYRQEQLADGRFDLLRGQARFLSPNSVCVRLRDGSEQIVHARTFILATGSRVSIPDIPGLQECGFLTSDDVLDASALPTSLIVLGGGPIALELAWFHCALGIPTTVIQRSPQLVRSMDVDVTVALQQALEASGMEIFTDTKIGSVVRKPDGLAEVTFCQNGKTHVVQASAVLCALGREPATQGLDLALAGVALNQQQVSTDTAQATSQPHIFAAGDLSGPHEIVHIAITQGETAATNAAVFLGKLPSSAIRHMDYRLKLFAMFTQPELASVGLTEKEARAAEIPVLTATYPFNDHGKSLVMGETAGFVKLIAHAESGELVGAAVVGPHASELIHEVVVALACRISAADFASIPHYHPTLSEIWTYPAEDLAERIPKGSAL